MLARVVILCGSLAEFARVLPLDSLIDNMLEVAVDIEHVEVGVTSLGRRLLSLPLMSRDRWLEASLVALQTDVVLRNLAIKLVAV